ncbi:hypothetical protein JMJ35_000185 [Cladonia borealis]|uniref:Rhodopsin domain-containing protein n=1 Tax=Cladonia borealis TaxID=184061 RepID=A0AA39R8X2_9LECA|nr:hypothetical protein JMJ35_000185 [Cladonia borealis]
MSEQYQYDHINETRVPALDIATYICLPAAFIAVIFRILSRRISEVPLKADDWWIFVGLLFTTASVGLDIVLTGLGLGRHAVLLEHPVFFAKLVLAKASLYNPAIFAIKISILLLYRRIFVTNCINRSFNISLWCTGGFVYMYCFVQAILTVFHCKPVNMLWDPTVKGTCINYDDVLITMASLNIGTDVLILCLPLPQLWRLQLPASTKRHLVGIFLLVCIASIIRAAYVGQISLTDPSWSDALGAMWTVVELSLGVVSACLPTLRPLVVRTFKSRTATYGISRESRLEDQDGSRMLHRIDSATKGSPQRNGFVNDFRPLDAYASMPSDEGLF